MSDEPTGNTAASYAEHPDHPLCGVPQHVLDVARGPLREAAQYKDVDPDFADPIADAVVSVLRQAGYLKEDL